MERTKHGKNSKKCVRLLVLVFLLSIIFISFDNDALAITVSDTAITTEQTVTIEIKIARDSYRNMLSVKNVLTLKSDASFEINTYELKEYNNIVEGLFEITISSLGESRFDVLLNDKKINQTPIKIFTVYPDIQSSTEFMWKIFTDDGTEITPPIIQGKKYFFVLYGAYHTTAHKIIDLSFEQSDTMLIEKNNTVQIPHDFLTQVAAFECVPLHYDEVQVPIVRITYATPLKAENIVSTARLSVSSIPNDSAENEAVIPAISLDDKPKHVTHKPLVKKNSADKMSTAYQLYQLRSAAAKKFLHVETLTKIKQCENDLDIKKSFFPIRKQLMRIALILLCCISATLILVCRSKKLFVVFFSCVVLISIIGCFKINGDTYGVIYAEYPVTLASIPEQNAQRTVELQLGETVLIKNKTDEWCYVETCTDNSGWIKCNCLLEINP